MDSTTTDSRNEPKHTRIGDEYQAFVPPFHQRYPFSDHERHMNHNTSACISNTNTTNIHDSGMDIQINHHHNVAAAEDDDDDDDDDDDNDMTHKTRRHIVLVWRPRQTPNAERSLDTYLNRITTRFDERSYLDEERAMFLLMKCGYSITRASAAINYSSSAAFISDTIAGSSHTNPISNSPQDPSSSVTRNDSLSLRHTPIDSSGSNGVSGRRSRDRVMSTRLGDDTVVASGSVSKQSSQEPVAVESVLGQGVRSAATMVKQEPKHNDGDDGGGGGVCNNATTTTSAVSMGHDVAMATYQSVAGTGTITMPAVTPSTRIDKPVRPLEYCFVCKHGGTVMLCDAPGCNRLYHTYCAGLDSVPEGEFRCGRHECALCRRPSDNSLQCNFCPVSYCTGHSPLGISASSRVPFTCINCATDHSSRVPFMKSLNSFHENSLSSRAIIIPIVDGRQLDLWSLYHSVITLGGFEIVNKEELWKNIASHLGFVFDNEAASNQIKIAYCDILLPYELAIFTPIRRQRKPRDKKKKLPHQQPKQSESEYALPLAQQQQHQRSLRAQMNHNPSRQNCPDSSNFNLVTPIPSSNAMSAPAMYTNHANGVSPVRVKSNAGMASIVSTRNDSTAVSQPFINARKRNAELAFSMNTSASASALRPSFSMMNNTPEARLSAAHVAAAAASAASAGVSATSSAGQSIVSGVNNDIHHVNKHVDVRNRNENETQSRVVNGGESRGIDPAAKARLAAVAAEQSASSHHSNESSKDATDTPSSAVRRSEPGTQDSSVLAVI